MTKENGTVAVPRDYFLRMAKLDYENHTLALAREFFQNSADAEASTIRVVTDEEKRIICVNDNGCGMDYDTIKNKLLVLGGTKKKSGDTGAFGKAKEVLFFSWEEYEVRTQDLVVKGKGADYTIERVNDWHEGVAVTLKIWRDESFYSIVEAFKTVASRFQVTPTIMVNGEVILCKMMRGTLVRSEDWADVYHDKNGGNNYYVSVRVNGQWMFNNWLGVDDIGKIVVEIKGHSLEALTSNRDGLKSEWKHKYNKFIQEISSDVRSAMHPPKKLIHEKFSGIGRVEVDREKLAAKMSSDILKVEDGTRKSAVISDAVMDVVLDAIPAENVTAIAIDRVVDSVTAIGNTTSEFWTYKDRFAFIGYKPDFVVTYEDGESRDMQYTLSTKKARILADAWTEVVKQVLLDIDKYLEFTCGFDYSQETTAAYRVVEGEVYFYLNPDLLLSDLKDIKNPMSNKTLLLEDLKLKACHEVTHLFYNYHNESFLLKFDKITASTWRSASMYKKIIRESFLTV